MNIVRYLNLSAGFLAESRFAICPDCAGSDCLFIYLWAIASAIDGLPFGDCVIRRVRLLLSAGFSRLCQSGLCAVTGMVCIYSYFADVCYWRLLAPSGPLNYRKIEEINRNKRLKPSSGHGLCLQNSVY